MKNLAVIVEDNPIQSVAIKNRLEAEGFVVVQIFDGTDVMSIIKLREAEIAIILLDIMLPNVDGQTLCMNIRRSTKGYNIPIIMTTARGTEVDKIVGLESGADDYMVKPIGLNELVARIRAVIRRASHRIETNPIDILESGNLLVQVQAKKVFRDGKVLPMPNKQFGLLVYLMRNIKVGLTRDAILANVWGFDSYVDKRTVDVHVRWIREKIEDDPSHPKRIVTLPGVGYIFKG